MSAEFEISYEVSQKMGMVLASCFEMVGLSTPAHITCDKMALVIDRIDKTRRALKKKLLFSTDETSGKIKKIGENNFGLKAKEEKAIRRKTKEIETEAFVLKQLEQEVKKEKTTQKHTQEIELQTVDQNLNDIPFMLDSTKDKTAIVASNLGIMRSQMKMLLKQHGYRVFLVNNLKELAFVIKNNRFDLVVTEIKEDKDLLNLTKMNINSHKEMLHMVISANLNNAEVKEYCKQMGVNIYIEKHADWQQTMHYKLEKQTVQELKYA